MNKKIISRLTIVIAAIALWQVFSQTGHAESNFYRASVTQGNSRLSYFAKTSGALSAGSTLVTIAGSGNADNNTQNIDPGDTVAIGTTNPSMTVGTIIDDTHFGLTTGIGASVAASTNVQVAQQSIWTISAVTTQQVESGGKFVITIPANDANSTAQNSDGYPDTAASVSVNGFDMNGIGSTAYITPPSNFTFSSVSLGGGGATDTTITFNYSGASLAIGTTITATIGNTTKGIVNPAPVGTSHTRGSADIYTVNLKTTHSDGSTIDSSDVKIAPVDGVFVSATVEETLSFSVESVAVGATVCNVPASVTSTAYSIPWGTITTATTYNAGQKLTVATNAPGGYSVTIEDNDQRGKNGNTCTGDTPSSGHYTFGSGTCIRDSACGGTSCTVTAARNWTDQATYPGLAYSLENTGTGTTAATFLYNGLAAETTCTTGTFCARQIYSVEDPDATKGTIMCGGGGNCSTNGPVNASSANVCYKLYVQATQPGGFYYNKVRYTATAVF